MAWTCVRRDWLVTVAVVVAVTAPELVFVRVFVFVFVCVASVSYPAHHPRQEAAVCHQTDHRMCRMRDRCRHSRNLGMT